MSLQRRLTDLSLSTAARATLFAALKRRVKQAKSSPEMAADYADKAKQCFEHHQRQWTKLAKIYIEKALKLNNEEKNYITLRDHIDTELDITQPMPEREHCTTRMPPLVRLQLAKFKEYKEDTTENAADNRLALLNDMIQLHPAHGFYYQRGLAHMETKNHEAAYQDFAIALSYMQTETIAAKVCINPPAVVAYYASLDLPLTVASLEHFVSAYVIVGKMREALDTVNLLLAMPEITEPDQKQPLQILRIHLHMHFGMEILDEDIHYVDVTSDIPPERFSFAAKIENTLLPIINGTQPTQSSELPEFEEPHDAQIHPSLYLHGRTLLLQGKLKDASECLQLSADDPNFDEAQILGCLHQLDKEGNRVPVAFKSKNESFLEKMRQIHSAPQDYYVSDRTPLIQNVLAHGIAQLEHEIMTHNKNASEAARNQSQLNLLSANQRLFIDHYCVAALAYLSRPERIWHHVAQRHINHALTLDPANAYFKQVAATIQAQLANQGPIPEEKMRNINDPNKPKLVRRLLNYIDKSTSSEEQDYQNIVIDTNILRIFPNAESYFRRGMAYYYRDNHPAAYADFQRLLATPGRPHQEDIMKLCLQESRPAVVIHYATLDLPPTDELLFHIARAYAAQGSLSTALKKLDLAFALPSTLYRGLEISKNTAEQTLRASITQDYKAEPLPVNDTTNKSLSIQISAKICDSLGKNETVNLKSLTSLPENQKIVWHMRIYYQVVTLYYLRQYDQAQVYAQELAESFTHPGPITELWTFLPALEQGNSQPLHAYADNYMPWHYASMLKEWRQEIQDLYVPQNPQALYALVDPIIARVSRHSDYYQPFKKIYFHRQHPTPGTYEEKLFAIINNNENFYYPEKLQQQLQRFARQEHSSPERTQATDFFIALTYLLLHPHELGVNELKRLAEQNPPYVNAQKMLVKIYEHDKQTVESQKMRRNILHNTHATTEHRMKHGLKFIERALAEESKESTVHADFIVLTELFITLKSYNNFHERFHNLLTHPKLTEQPPISLPILQKIAKDLLKKIRYQDNDLTWHAHRYGNSLLGQCFQYVSKSANFSWAALSKVSDAHQSRERILGADIPEKMRDITAEECATLWDKEVRKHLRQKLGLQHIKHVAQPM